MVNYALLLAALFTATAVGLTDFRTGRMPNALTLGSLGCALLLRTWGGGDSLISGGVGLLATAGVPLFMFLATGGRAIGGGDVKALAALGAWLGPDLGLLVCLTSFALLIVWVLIQRAHKGRLLTLLKGRSDPDLTELRLGPSLALSTFACCAVNVWGSAGLAGAVA